MVFHSSHDRLPMLSSVINFLIELITSQIQMATLPQYVMKGITSTCMCFRPYFAALTCFEVNYFTTTTTVYTQQMSPDADSKQFRRDLKMLSVHLTFEALAH